MRERDVLIQFLLNRKEADRFNALVERSGVTRSTYLRQLINGLVPVDKPTPDFYQMVRELHSIGNNLNQVAFRAHVSGSVDAARYEKNADELALVTAKIVEAVFEPRRLE